MDCDKADKCLQSIQHLLRLKIWREEELTLITGSKPLEQTRSMEQVLARMAGFVGHPFIS